MPEPHRLQMAGDDIEFLRARRRPNYEDGRSPVRLVDLFAGCGGISLGVAEAARACGRGLDVRLSAELVDDVRAVYDQNFRSAIKSDRSDVTSRFNRSPGERLSPVERETARATGLVDFLVGGPPCQGHSDLNNHTRRRDPKNELYMVMVRAAEVLMPSHVIIENVQGIRNDHSGVLDRAVSALGRLHYRVDHGLVRLVDVGVPQTRVRHILVASLQSEPKVARAVDHCRVDRPRTLSWAIRDLQGAKSSSLMDSPAKMSSENVRRAKHLVDTDTYDLPNPLRPRCHRDKPEHRYTAMYGRLRWTSPAPTITTGFGSPGQGRYLHPTQLRTLTPHEAARIQFFPDWFDFGKDSRRSVLAHCIGNAVPSKLAFVLALDRILAAPAGDSRST